MEIKGISRKILMELIRELELEDFSVVPFGATVDCSVSIADKDVCIMRLKKNGNITIHKPDKGFVNIQPNEYNTIALY